MKAYRYQPPVCIMGKKDERVTKWKCAQERIPHVSQDGACSSEAWQERIQGYTPRRSLSNSSKGFLKQKVTVTLGVGSKREREHQHTRESNPLPHPCQVFVCALCVFFLIFPWVGKGRFLSNYPVSFLDFPELVPSTFYGSSSSWPVWLLLCMH